jgi:hypothetical protein
LKTPNKKYYSSCEFLPLWNFFKLNNGEPQSLKYLVVETDRLAYSTIELREPELSEAEILWGKIYEEYNSLEKNFGAINFLNDKSKILYYYSIYLQEQAVLKSLLYRTNVGHIRFLRKRGYNISNKSQLLYWESLTNGLKKVENHLTYIQILRNKMTDVSKDSKKEGNPYDAIMAWIASNDIRVEENITVSRYVKIKEIILSRQKAKRQETQSRLHG